MKGSQPKVRPMFLDAESVDLIGDEFARRCNRCELWGRCSDDPERRDFAPERCGAFRTVCRNCRNAANRKRLAAKAKTPTSFKTRGPASSWLPVEPLRVEIARWLACQKGTGRNARVTLATRAHLTERRITSIMNGEQQRVTLDVADRLAFALGSHLTLIYDYEDTA